MAHTTQTTSIATRLDTAHSPTNPVLGIGQGDRKVLEPAPHVSQLRTRLPQFLLGRGRVGIQHVGATPMPDLHPAFLLEQAHCFASRTNRDVPGRREISIRGQLVPGVVSPLVNLGAELISNASARPPLTSLTGRFIAHGPSVPPTVLTRP
jgi:hypothetical protein